MKNTLRRLVILVLSLTITVSLFSVVSAAEGEPEAQPYASLHFALTDVYIAPLGGGKIAIEAETVGTGTMDEIGVSSITVWAKNANGTNTLKKTYTRYNTSGMIRTNSSYHFVRLDYAGVAGTQYYVIVAFYAKDSRGGETLRQTSKTITATTGYYSDHDNVCSRICSGMES